MGMSILLGGLVLCGVLAGMTVFLFARSGR